MDETSKIVHGEVIIRVAEDTHTVQGQLEIHMGKAGLDETLAHLEKTASPWRDYYVFTKPSTPDQDSPTSFYILSTDANAYDGSVPSDAQFSLFAAPSGSTLIELSGARFVRMLNNHWTETIQEVDVNLTGNQNERSLQLLEKLREVLCAQIKGKVLGEDELSRLIIQSLSGFGGLIQGVDKPTITLIPNQRNSAAPGGGTRISITVRPNPEGLILVGFPNDLSEKALTWLDDAVTEAFATHPLMIMRRKTSIGTPSELKLVRVDENGRISWRYPEGVPEKKSFARDLLAKFLVDAPVDRAPEIEPGAVMPIPQDVLARFGEWLKTEMSGISGGLHDIKTVMQENGAIVLLMNSRPFPQYRLAADRVGEIDLEMEAQQLKKGTRYWSQEKLERFVEGLKAKFRQFNRDLLTEHPYFITQNDDGSLRINLISIPFTSPDKIFIDGDLDLPGIGGKKAIAAIFGTSPLSTEQIRERLLEIEDFYHQNGYLIAGETPTEHQGVQLNCQMSNNGDVSLRIKVARLGKIIIAGDLAETSKQALINASGIKPGEPFVTKTIIGNLNRANQRLDLQFKDNSSFILRENGIIDISFPVSRAEHSVRASVGANSSGSPVGGFNASLHHAIPGTSNVSGNFQIGQRSVTTPGTGKTSNNLSLGTSIVYKTIPLTDGGITVEGGVNFDRTPYTLWGPNSRAVESDTRTGGGTAISFDIPLGNQGIASPWWLSIGTYGNWHQFEGTSLAGNVSRTDKLVGANIGVGYGEVGIFTGRDQFRARASSDFAHVISSNSFDATFGADASYRLPLGSDFVFEAQASGRVRIPLSALGLPNTRNFTSLDVPPLVDFARSPTEPYNSTYYGRAGAFLSYEQNKAIQPFVGVTTSTGPNGQVRAGAGVGVKVPILGGLSIYWGVDQDGNSSINLGLSR